MSQAAPPGLTKVMQQGGGYYHFFIRSGLARLALLLAASVGLTLWLASGQANANFLFQSPESPPPFFEPDPFISPFDQVSPIEQPPIEQPPLEQSSPFIDPNAPPPLPAEAAPAPPLPPEPGRRNREERPREEANTGPSNFILDQAELIDTVVVTGAWMWLCCGILLLLVVPLFFVVMYIRGRRKIIDQEGYR